jgi:hypothetical protein
VPQVARPGRVRSLSQLQVLTTPVLAPDIPSQIQYFDPLRVRVHDFACLVHPLLANGAHVQLALFLS